MRSARQAVVVLFFVMSVQLLPARTPRYSMDEAVAAALDGNPDVAIARKKVEAARGGVIQARSGFLPSVVSTGLFRERQHQSESRLRNEDYSANIRIIQNLYTGGAITSQKAIAQLNLEKQELELKAVSDRVAMDVRVAYNELLLNQARVRVHEQSFGVLEQELKTQQERFSAGLVGQLNVHRAEVAAANQKTEVIDAQTQVNSSYLRLGELLGKPNDPNSNRPLLDVYGQLQYSAIRPDLNQCLGRADTARPEVLMRKIDVEIETWQENLDRSEQRPQVEAFSGYEIYNERDPAIGEEFNHGYVVGVNARWHIFDGYATRGKLIATRARREAAEQALAAARSSVSSEVRNAFLDLQQADRMLEAQTKSVQTADESLEIAKANVEAGLATQLDVLQAAADVTSTRTTRLNGIYLHNVALAKLARACSTSPDALGFGARRQAQAAAAASGNPGVTDMAQPPKKLSQR
jgi:outer membrane protein TolC